MIQKKVCDKSTEKVFVWARIFTFVFSRIKIVFFWLSLFDNTSMIQVLFPLQFSRWKLLAFLFVKIPFFYPRIDIPFLGLHHKCRMICCIVRSLKIKYWDTWEEKGLLDCVKSSHTSDLMYAWLYKQEYRYPCFS